MDRLAQYLNRKLCLTRLHAIIAFEDILKIVKIFYIFLDSSLFFVFGWRLYISIALECVIHEENLY